MVRLAKAPPGNAVLRGVVRSLSSLPKDLTLGDALRRMTAEHLHLALVRGEGGKVVGMITQEDIFEELVGDIQDEFDTERAECATLGRDAAQIELTGGGGGRTLDENSARIEQLQALGVTRVILPPLPGDKLDGLAEGLRDRFGMDS